MQDPTNTTLTKRKEWNALTSMKPLKLTSHINHHFIGESISPQLPLLGKQYSKIKSNNLYVNNIHTHLSETPPIFSSAKYHILYSK